MQSSSIPQAVNHAIIAYITIVGTVIAYFMNHGKQSEFANFHIRQALGLNLFFCVFKLFLSIVNSDLGLLAFYIYVIILWLFGFMAAINQKKETVPLLGDYFQKWLGFIK